MIKTTALMFAGTGGRVEFVRLLLDHHAKIDAEDVNQVTALIPAAVFNHVDVVRLLLNRGVNIEAAQHRSVPLSCWL